MREADAKKRVAAAPEGLCIRYLHDEHGNVWFADTPLVAPRSLLRKGAGLAALALMPILTACMGSANAAEPDETTTEPAPTPDAGRDARTIADPVVDTDSGSDDDAAADAGSD